jgi:hypothetical protein
MLANEAGFTLPASAIFTHQTVARLATSLKTEEETQPGIDANAGDELLELDSADLDAIRDALS